MCGVQSLCHCRAIILAIMAVGGSFATAAAYYVDCQAGRDQNDGTSPLSAWRTMERANQQVYGPGDSVLLKRGCVWQGSGFKARGDGSVFAPITLADYGEPHERAPVIDGVGAHEPAILLQNVQNWTVRNLELTQQGQTPQNLDPNNEKGKDADQYSDEYMRAVIHVLGLGPPDDPNCGEACTVRNIRLENLVVRDGSWNGIYASGGYYQLRTARFGFVDNLVITGVESFNHHKAGVEITCTYYKTRTYAASNIWVLNSRLHHNGGDGVMVGPVRNGLLEGNVCSYNGRIRNARVGCWTWDSENTTIQFNESHHNMTPLNNSKARDGAGFDLDLGTENGMIQYNWSHDNEGEGYLLLSWPIGFGYDRGTSRNIQMRYNVSERDGKKLGGGITIFGGVSPAVIYNNVIYYESARSAGTEMFNGEGGALTSSVFGKSGQPDARIFNNIFIINGRTNSTATSNNLWTDGAGTFTFNNNIWWRVEGGVRFQWGGSIISSWANWRGMGFDAQSFNADPLTVGTFGSGPEAYQLRARSPAVDRAHVVSDALRGMGSRDYLGVPTAQGPAYDIGAFEYKLVPDPARFLQIVRQLDGASRLGLAGTAGRNYTIQRSANLQFWTSIGTALETFPGSYEFVDTAQSPAFYRAVVNGEVQ